MWCNTAHGHRCKSCNLKQLMWKVAVHVRSLSGAELLPELQAGRHGAISIAQKSS